MGLLDNDRATLLGALLDLSGQLRGACDTDPAHLRARWRQHRLRTLAAERDCCGRIREAGGRGSGSERYGPAPSRKPGTVSGALAVLGTAWRSVVFG